MSLWEFLLGRSKRQQCRETEQYRVDLDVATRMVDAHHFELTKRVNRLRVYQGDPAVVEAVRLALSKTILIR